jgi:hypothetical protein
MKTIHPAPVGADPVGSFLATLPRKATVLGCKGYCIQGKKTISVVYSVHGVVHCAECSYQKKGGES